MTQPIWKDITGYENRYQVSSEGRVKRLARTIICRNGIPKPLREQILTPHLNSNGYLWVQLIGPSGKDFRFVHRLVASAFVANPKRKPCVNHKNGIKTDNGTNNLEWVTRKENTSHAFASGLMSHAGEKNSQSKLTNESVRCIRLDRASGMKVQDIAAKYIISRRRVYDVINHRCWGQVA